MIVIILLIALVLVMVVYAGFTTMNLVIDYIFYPKKERKAIVIKSKKKPTKKRKVAYEKDICINPFTQVASYMNLREMEVSTFDEELFDSKDGYKVDFDIICTFCIDGDRDMVLVASEFFWNDFYNERLLECGRRLLVENLKKTTFNWDGKDIKHRTSEFHNELSNNLKSSLYVYGLRLVDLDIFSVDVKNGDMQNLLYMKSIIEKNVKDEEKCS